VSRDLSCERFLALPVNAPIWGFTAHVGGRTPSRVHIWVSPHFLFMAVSQLSICMCLMCGLPSLSLYCFHGCAAYVLCVGFLFIMNAWLIRSPWLIRSLPCPASSLTPCGTRHVRRTQRLPRPHCCYLMAFLSMDRPAACRPRSPSGSQCCRGRQPTRQISSSVSCRCTVRR